MMLYTESVADQTDHFAKVFVCGNIAYGCCDDVMAFESLHLTPFCLEKSSVKNGYFNVLAVFQ